MAIMNPEIYRFLKENDPLPFQAPIVKKKLPPLSGLSNFVDLFEKDPPPERVIQDTPIVIKAKKRAEKVEKHKEELRERILEYKPKENPRATLDAMRTLFVGRLHYSTTEEKLLSEYSEFGPISQVVLARDPKGKSRGYAFIQFEVEADMKDAYRRGDGRKIDGRRVVVDVERGRTVPGWLPRRLGGGIGDTRKGGKDVNVFYSGRPPTGALACLWSCVSMRGS